MRTSAILAWFILFQYPLTTVDPSSRPLCFQLFTSHHLAMPASPKRYTKKDAQKRPGGIQSRMRSAAEEVEKKSSAHALLMELFAQGCMSAVLCHRIAQAVQKDIAAAHEGYVFPDLQKLASLSQGRTVPRFVHSRLAQTDLLPQPCLVDIPFADGAHLSGIIMPHELFASIYKTEAMWKKILLPDSLKLPSLWDALDAHPALQNHPVKRKRDYRIRVLPLTMHGDEVPCMGIGKIWSRSVLNFSWCSLLANAMGGKMADIMQYIWGCFEKFCVETSDNDLGTMDTFYRILAWSFQALAEGVWPQKDWRGVPFPKTTPAGKNAGKSLADGYCAVLLFLCGDLDYFQKWIHCPNPTNHAKPCVQCKATFFWASDLAR